VTAPRWVRRAQLFLGIVWRPWYGGRMSARLAWSVALAMYPREVER
jgi:hypothetical protein